jgi:hypothetical protein
MKSYVPVGIAAARLGVSHTQIARLLNSGALEAVYEIVREQLLLADDPEKN